MKVGVYLRVSTDEQTVENQRGPLLELAARRNWEPVLYEETWSGRDDQRPELLRMLEDCRRGRLHAVAVVALDRLSRRVKHLLKLFEDFDRWGVQCVSLREPWSETTEDGALGRMLRDLVLHVLGFAGELEVINLRTRTRAGMKRAKEQGTRSGRPIGRPRTSRLQLGAAAAMVQSGTSQRKAAEECGVSATALRRHMRGLEASRKAEGAEAAPVAPPAP